MQTPKTRVVLFSGGSASNHLASQLERRGLHVSNVLVVFDNGGSTGALRRASPMPAMGDIRNRLTALADVSGLTQKMLKELFEFRFSERKAENQLRQELQSLLNSTHPLISDISELQRNSVLEALRKTVAILPETFSLRDQSLGNLLLFGRKLDRGDFLQAVEWARELLGVASDVLPVTLEPAHLGAQLDTERWITGQAGLTSERYHLPGNISRLCLLRRENSFAVEVKPPACPAVLDSIKRADALLIGFGSFYTSIVPHFLVRGIGSAFASQGVPRILLCNPTVGRESEYLTVESMLGILNDHIARDGTSMKMPTPMISHIIHYGPDRKAGIPSGDLNAFSKGGGQYLSDHKSEDFGQIAASACDTIFSILGHSPTQPIKVPVPRSSAPVVILFDLDATLFDYSALRADATRAALDGFVSDPKKISQYLAELLRPPLTDLLFGLGLPDLRRKWDSPEVFAIALLLTDPLILKDFQAMAEGALNLSRPQVTTTFRTSIRLGRLLAQMESTKSVVPAVLSLVASSHHNSFTSQRKVFVEYVENNAVLAFGAKEIISRLKNLDAEIHVVTEGDSDIQAFKFKSLRLQDLAETCIVTDATCGLPPVLNEFASLFRSEEQIPTVVSELYDFIELYSMKSRPFFAKLLHSLVDRKGGSLRERIESPRFLTAEEWNVSFRPSVFMVGDRYEKDIEPFLRACNSGIRAFRILTGKYAKENSLYELIGEGRPLPQGVFANLSYLADPLIALAKEPFEPIERPEPVLPGPDLIESVISACPELSEDARRALVGLKVEALRHREAK